MAIIEAYGIAAAVSAKIPLVRIYSILSFFAVAVVAAVEVLRLVLHFTFKKALISNCVNDLSGQTETIQNGGIFSPHTVSQPISTADATNACNNAWSNDTFQDVAWLLVSASELFETFSHFWLLTFGLVLGFLFATVTLAYYRQLMDPSLLRTQAPSSAFQMNATRNAFGYRNSSYVLLSAS